ncbi:hypothetical protein [Agrobacterium tumefaciens]|uniref:hypothetical protein n=1 Tax=Agrobacterium tumefaciens TaxID=358 RepID=UPI00054FE429|nr:hypothetical protein [Agrobacterium tumefaciens]
MTEIEKLTSIIEDLRSSIKSQQDALMGMHKTSAAALSAAMASHIAVTSMAAVLRKTHDLDCEAVGRSMRGMILEIGDETMGLEAMVRLLAAQIEDQQSPEPTEPAPPRTRPTLVK